MHRFPKTIGCLAKNELSTSIERLTLYLMTFQVSCVSSLVSGETCVPFNSFLCGEPWHVESWNSWRATSSYFHSKQTLQRLPLPLRRLRTVASFQGHHLRALLIIWQVFSKINYSQLRGYNYAGWRDSVTFSSSISKSNFPLIKMSMGRRVCLAVFLMYRYPLGGRNKQG